MIEFTNQISIQLVSNAHLCLALLIIKMEFLAVKVDIQTEQ